MVHVYYDLHIHSALSPCADNDMTPNDIVGMALLNGLDIIAITDHNSFSNAASVVNTAKKSRKQAAKELVVLPGIEVSTAEEVHVLCLFSDIESALSFESNLSPRYSNIPNRIDIFGNQVQYNEDDRVIGEVERMLIAPTSISFDDLHQLTHDHDGAFIPAHIDRDSFSVISNLGFLPPHLEINTVEVSSRGFENGFDVKTVNLPTNGNIIFSSDAHQLWSISERKHFLLLPELSAKAAIDFLC
ncbi:MAG: PHP domain-containing protein [Oscillospiraceae bacterium]|nr:PHP domain-containing protein [Oscillospiraceae bacterium]